MVEQWIPNPKVEGSIPSFPAKLNAIVEQLVSLSPCHGEGCEFESRLLRQRNMNKMQMYNNWLVYLPVKEKVVGSNPIICAKYNFVKSKTQ